MHGEGSIHHPDDDSVLIGSLKPDTDGISNAGTVVAIVVPMRRRKYACTRHEYVVGTWKYTQYLVGFFYETLWHHETSVVDLIKLVVCY